MVKARSPKAFFTWAAALAAVAVVMIGGSAGEPRPVVRIPAGASATLDGSLDRESGTTRSLLPWAMR